MSDATSCPYCAAYIPWMYPNDQKNQEAMHRRHLVFEEAGYPIVTYEEYEAQKTEGREQVQRALSPQEEVEGAMTVLRARYGRYIHNLILYGLTPTEPVLTFDQYVSKRDLDEFGQGIAAAIRGRKDAAASS